MSADQESKNTSQEETDQSQDGQSRASSDRESKGNTQIYRVNRLGREIFVGDKSLLIQAIQSRRVRGDDLIYDQSQDLWGFLLSRTADSRVDIENQRGPIRTIGVFFCLPLTRAPE